MATIDNLDVNVNYLYAIRTRLIEDINAEMSVNRDSTIPPQTALVNLTPRLTDIDILLGIVPLFTPWAYFLPPKNFRLQRRSAFAFWRVAPSLGSLQQQAEDEAKLAAVACSSPDEVSEKEAIGSCLKQIDKINGWIGFIVGRIGQFLQG